MWMEATNALAGGYNIIYVSKLEIIDALNIG